MKTIPLTQGYVALVDDEDFERINQHKWYVLKAPRVLYAVRCSATEGGKRRTIFMHREILGLVPFDGISTDHRDHKGLNNRRYNIRKCTTQQNQRNCRKNRDRILGFKGVHVYCGRKGKRWWARISAQKGKLIHLGTFDTEIEAAKAYDKAATKLFGEFALLNFPGDLKC